MKRTLAAILLSALVCASAVAAGQAASGAAKRSEGQYRVGVGIADMTGEAAEVGMMGYARLDQQTSGIHSRQWARAFAIAQPSGNRAVFVNTDADMVMQGVHQEVMKRLAARFGTRYTATNVILSANHTHSGPGGFSHHLLYNLTTLGYQQKTWEAMVAGIVRAIESADADLAPGTVKIATGTLTTASVNRSMDAFLRNPAADRARFPGAIDPTMTVLRFEQGDRPVGMISWFPTHGTSMTPTNTLISPDNKGYAAYHVEHDVHGVEWEERGEFVAAFAQTNAGDMSPNLRDGGARGPTDDEFRNTEIIGKMQADKAMELFRGATEVLSGPIDARQRYVDFSNIQVAGRYTPDGKPQRTCPAAVGQALTAGAEDGPGPDIAEEGELASNPLLTAAGVVIAPTPEDVRRCQAPKPIFLATGSQSIAWTPKILPLQLVRIGQLTLTAVPAEFTIVAGHRLRETVASELGSAARHIVLAGYSNAYSHYVTTPEEYDAQHYEGAVTYYGRYTLPAYQQEFARLAAALRQGEATPSSVTPPWLGDRQWSVKAGVVLDTPHIGRNFGDVITQPAASYRRGQQVSVTFQTGHPNNNLRNEGTFLQVQRLVGGSWKTVATDNDWSTIYRWKRDYVSVSNADISWTIPADAPAGTYRIVHHGDARDLFGGIRAFTGTTKTFTVS